MSRRSHHKPEQPPPARSPFHPRAATESSETNPPQPPAISSPKTPTKIRTRAESPPAQSPNPNPIATQPLRAGYPIQAIDAPHAKPPNQSAPLEASPRQSQSPESLQQPPHSDNPRKPSPAATKISQPAKPATPAPPTSTPPPRPRHPPPPPPHPILRKSSRTPAFLLFPNQKHPPRPAPLDPGSIQLRVSAKTRQIFQRPCRPCAHGSVMMHDPAPTQNPAADPRPDPSVPASTQIVHHHHPFRRLPHVTQKFNHRFRLRQMMKEKTIGHHVKTQRVPLRHAIRLHALAIDSRTIRLRRRITQRRPASVQQCQIDFNAGSARPQHHSHRHVPAPAGNIQH